MNVGPMQLNPISRRSATLAVLLACQALCLPALRAQAVTDAPVAPASAAPAAVPPVRAHHPSSAARRLDQHVRALAQALDLDPEQQAGVRAILIKERVAFLDLRRGGGQGAQDVVAASHAIVARTRNDIRELLNPEQRKKFFVDVPEGKLAPAQADLDYWRRATQSPPDPTGKTR